MSDVRTIKVSPLLFRRVKFGVEQVRSAAMVIGGPFVEVVGDIKCRGIEACVFEVDNDNLRRINVRL